VIVIGKYHRRRHTPFPAVARPYRRETNFPLGPTREITSSVCAPAYEERNHGHYYLGYVEKRVPMIVPKYKRGHRRLPVTIFPPRLVTATVARRTDTRCTTATRALTSVEYARSINTFIVHTRAYTHTHTHTHTHTELDSWTGCVRRT